VQHSLSCLKASLLLRVFHYWRSYGAEKQHNRNVFDVFFHEPLSIVLFKAVRKGMLRAVRACVSKGLDLTIARNMAGQSALHLASANGNVAIINVLMQARVPVNVQDNNGCTALHYAVEHGHEDAVCLLLNNFASTSLQDKLGRRAFDVGGRHGNIERVQIALKLKNSNSSS